MPLPENRPNNNLETLPFKIGGAVLIGEALGSEFIFSGIASRSSPDMVLANNYLAAGDKNAYEATIAQSQAEGYKGMVGGVIISPAIFILGFVILQYAFPKKK